MGYFGQYLGKINTNTINTKLIMCTKIIKSWNCHLMIIWCSFCQYSNHHKLPQVALLPLKQQLYLEQYGNCTFLGNNTLPWWRHQVETFSALLAICAGNSPGTGEFPAQRPVTRSFDVFCDLRLNKRLSKQSWGWWFGTLSRPWWRYCNADRGNHSGASRGVGY